MKKNELTMSVFAALLAVSTVAMAEDQYPASNFEPKVVFQDENAAGSSSSSSSAPASSSSSSSSSSSGGDSEYPASDFQPKVVFEDKEYKHSDNISGSSSSAVGNGGSASSSASASAQKDESSIGYLLGLLVLGIAGYVLFKKGVVGAAMGGNTSRVAAPSASGLTGVARYLLKTSGTGVSRYLEKQVGTAPSAKTGVAKYLASQGQSSGSSVADRAATGVEKYMRNKR